MKRGIPREQTTEATVKETKHHSVTVTFELGDSEWKLLNELIGATGDREEDHPKRRQALRRVVEEWLLKQGDR